MKILLSVSFFEYAVLAAILLFNAYKSLNA